MRSVRELLSPRNRAWAVVLVQIGTLIFGPVIAAANPLDPAVVAGQATFSAGGHELTINAADHTIINWQGFSIGAGEITNFVQPSASSVVLNRVIGGDPSAIYGTLNANGNVYLINPHGILVGPSGQINVNGLILSTLDISNQQFLKGGALDFEGTSRGTIVNQGHIRALEGNVFLMADRVENSGFIQASHGTAGLIAARNVTLVDSAHPTLVVRPAASSVGKADGGVSNSGLVEAATAQLIAAHGNVYALAINNTGTVRVNGAITEEGHVYLVANGGKVVERGNLTAQNADGTGGQVTIDAGAGGSAEVSGKIDVTGTTGGRVAVTGETVNVVGATIDASGVDGGGTVLVGGDYQGKNPEVLNAANTSVDATSVVRADALQSGDGGKIIVWAEELNRTAGNVSARGGLLGGDGGFVEISGKNQLVMNAAVDTLAPLGRAGMLLLDPTNFSINAGGGGLTVNSIGANSLVALLGANNVTIQTATAGSDNGNISVDSNVAWSAAHDLTLSAYSDIVVRTGVSVTSTGGGNLILQADNTGTGIGTFANLGTVSLSGGGSVSAYYNPNAFGTPRSFPNVSVTGGGSFTAYMLVNNMTNLQAIGNHLADNFALGRNLDASSVANFRPIGDFGTGYSGHFDGQGHTISQLTISQTFGLAGLFGFVVGGATISNVGLLDVDVAAANTVGALAGLNRGTITNAYSTGIVYGNSPEGKADSMGGLVGVNSGIITKSHSEATVVGTKEVGGLVGTNRYSQGNGISNSYSTGSVTGFQSVGGLVGYDNGYIDTSYSTGTVNGVGVGATWVGGLVGSYADLSGSSTAKITNSYSTGAVNVSGSTNVGGLVGTGGVGFVSNSYWNTETSGRATSAGGTGLSTAQMFQSSNFTGFDFTSVWFQSVGNTLPMHRSEYSTTITNANQLQLIIMNIASTYTLAQDIDLSRFRGAAAGFYSIRSGAYKEAVKFRFDGQGHTISNLTMNGNGLFHNNVGTIENVGLINANVSGDSSVGALAGSNAGSITNSYSTGTVHGSLNVGGLVGKNFDPHYVDAVGRPIVLSPSVTNSYSTADVSGEQAVGGLLGQNGHRGSVTDVYSTGRVSGDIAAGGLVGINSLSESTITNAFSTGEVGGSSSTDSGGLVGENVGTIVNAYSTGTVHGYRQVGGLVGRNSGTISVAYSTGDVAYTRGTTSLNFGGLVGLDNGTVSRSFWDTQTSEMSTSAAGLGLTTAQMQQQVNFTSVTAANGNVNPNWDFGGTWLMISGRTDPLLRFAGGLVSGVVFTDAAGTTPAGAGQQVVLARNGNFQNTNIVTNVTDATGFYYYQVPNLAAGQALLAYIGAGPTDATITGATVVATTSDSFADLNIYGNTLTAGDSSSNSTFVQAKGAISAATIPFSTSGNNLTLASGIFFNVPSGNTFALDGNLTAPAGVLIAGTLGGSGTVNGNTTLTGGSISFSAGGSLNGTLAVTGGAWNGLGSVTGLITSSSGTFNLGFTSTPSSSTGAVLTALGGLNITGGTIARTAGPDPTIIGAINYTSSSSSTYSGRISGASSLTMNAPGATLTLAGFSSYTGATNVTAGTLQVNGSLYYGTDSLGSLIPGTNVHVATAGTLKGLGTIAGNVTVTGAGIINLQSGASILGTLNATGGNWNGLGSVTGLVTSSSGSFAIGGGANLAANGGLSVTGGSLAAFDGTSTITGSVNYTSGANSTFAGVIAGNGNTLTMNNGAATLTLTGANTYTGLTTVTAGKLSLGVGGSLATASSLSVNGGTFDVGANNQSLASVQLVSGTLLGSGSLTSATTFDLRSGDVAMILSGTAGATKTTGGIVTMTGANAYTGLTTITAGNLLLGVSGSLNVLGSLSVNGGSFDVGVNNQSSAGVQLLSGTLMGDGSLTSAAAFDLRSGDVSVILSGTSGVTKTTSGLVTLTGANTYTGPTTVTAGKLALGVGGSLNALGSLVVNGGTFDVGANNQTLAGVQLAGGTLEGGGSLASGAAFDLQAGTVSVVLSGSAGLTKTTSGTVTLSAENTYTGATNVSAGTLQLDGALAVGSKLNITATGILAGVGTIQDDVTYASGSSSTFAGVIAGAGTTLTLNNSAATLTLTGASTYTGLTTVTAGTLSIAASGTLFNGGALTLGSAGRASFANAGQVLGAVNNGNAALGGLTFSATTGTITLASLTGGDTVFSAATAINNFQAGTAAVAGDATLGTAGLTTSLTGPATLSSGRDILVNSAIAWNSADSLSLSAVRNIQIAAGAGLTSSGGGNIVLHTDAGGTGIGTLNGSAPITVTGGGDVDLYYNPTVFGTPDLFANVNVTGGGGFTPYMLVNSLTNLQAIGGHLAGAYALGRDLEAASLTGFTPLGNSATPFTGRFDGQAHTIATLTINGGAGDTGLFGATSAAAEVRNVGLVDVRVSGGDAVGGLVGTNRGLITGAQVTGVVAGENGVGGLVGSNTGRITGAYSTATVAGVGQAGGLVGDNAGAVTGVYSTGLVSGTTDVGGLVGLNTGSVANGYWDTQTSGRSTSAGGIGLTTAQMFSSSNFVGFDFTQTWFQLEGSTRPFLQAEYGTTISNVHQLQLMALRPAAAYTLARDLDLSEVSSASGLWNTTTGFVPIGSADAPFTGRFDGQGHVLDHLTINLPSGSNVGLFGSTGNGAVIRAVGLTHVNVIGNDSVGGLVGSNGGTITGGAYVGGTIQGNTGVGGVAGFNSGTVDNAYAGVAVTVTGGDNVGGLIGWNVGTITNSYSLAAVGGGSGVGGLVGKNDGAITAVYSTGAVSGTANVGGLIGINGGSVLLGFWDTQTSGRSTSAGGLGRTTAQMFSSSNFFVSGSGGFDFAQTWFQVPGSTRPFLRSEFVTEISNAHQLQLMPLNPGAAYTLAGDLDLSETTLAAGLWNTSTGFVPIGAPLARFEGTFDGRGYTISNLKINLPTTDYVGLFGYTYTTGAIKNVRLTNVDVTGRDNVGALVGNADIARRVGTIADVSVVGTVRGRDFVGGLVGYNQVGISNASSAVNVSGREYVGGLMGVNGRDISNVSSTGSVTGTGDFVGGLAGLSGGAIFRGSSTGAVRGHDFVGGLAGQANWIIGDSYNTGSVAGNADVGGAVGYNLGPSVNVYSTGAVSGVTRVGGLAGSQYDSPYVYFQNSFWDTQTSGQSTSAAGLGLTTAQLQQQANFTSATSANGNVNPNWNFTSTWTMVDGRTYPLLQFSGKLVSGFVYTDATGTTPAAAGQQIALALNGTAVSSKVAGSNVTDAAGFYFFQAPGVVGTQSLLAYVSAGPTGRTISGGTAMTTAGVGISNLNIYGNTLTALGSAVSNATFVQAKGTLTAPTIPYSFLGNNLSLASGIGFSVPSGNSFTLNGNVTTLNRLIDIAGSLAVGESAAAKLSTQGSVGGGKITIAGAVNGTLGGGSERLTLDAGTGTLDVAGLFGAAGAADASGLTNVTITSAGATTFHGPIAITGALSQANAATGPTTFAGTVAVGTAELRGTTISQTQDFVATGAIALHGGTYTLGAGTTLTAGGGLNVAAGSLVAGSATSRILGSVNYTSGANSTFAGVIAGNGNTLTMNNVAATLTLTGANTYTGLTTVTAGKLALGLGGSLNALGSLSVSGGTFDGGANDQTFASVQLVSGMLLGGGSITSVAAFDLQAGDVSVILSGTAGTAKTTGGIVTLTGANTYTGLTTVTAGKFSLGIGGSLNALSGLSVNGGTFDVGSNDQTLAGVQLLSGSLIGSGSLTSDSAFDLRAGDVSVILGGTTGATKTTAGLVTLSKANTYTGRTSITGGTLQLDLSGSLSSAGTLSVDGGTFDVGANDQQFTAMQLLSGALIGTGSLTSDTAFDLRAGDVSAILGGTAGATKTTLGNVTLSNVNTYTGLTTVTAGTLRLATGVSVGALAPTGTLSVDGGTFDVGANGQTLAGVQLLGGSLIGAGSLVSAATFDLQAGDVSVILAGTSGLTKTTTGLVTLTAINTYTGATTVSAGTLQLDGALAVGNKLNITATGVLAGIGTIQDDVIYTSGSSSTFAGVIDGVGTTLTLDSAAATFTLTGANTYTGLTAVTAGTLSIAPSGRLFDGGALTLGSAGRASFANVGQVLGAVNNGNAALGGLKFSAITGTITLASLAGGDTIFAAAAEIGAFQAGTATVAGDATLGTAGVTTSLTGPVALTSGRDVVVNGTIAWNSADALSLRAAGDVLIHASLQNAGSGDLTLQADLANTGVGDVRIGAGAQTVGIAVGSAFGTTSVAGANLLLTGGSLVDAFAQLGYRAEAGADAAGAIGVSVRNDVALTAGSATGSYAQIGHGGLNRGVQGNLGGDLFVVAGNDVSLVGAGSESYAQIGHGGWNLGSRGSLAGDVLVAVSQAESTGGLTMNASSLIDAGGAPNHVRIFSAAPLQNHLADGAVINGFRLAGSLAPATFTAAATGGVWNFNIPAVIWDHEQYGYAFAGEGSLFAPFTAPFTFYYAAVGTEQGPVSFFTDNTTTDRFPAQSWAWYFDNLVPNVAGPSITFGGGPSFFELRRGTMAGMSSFQLFSP